MRKQDDIKDNDKILDTDSQNNIENSNEKIYGEFPIHSFLLGMHRDYFKKLFGKSGMKEESLRTVTIKVQNGQGKYFEQMIQAFYNPEVLNDSQIFDLLQLMDIGSMFLCDTFLGFCIKALNKVEVNKIMIRSS